MVVELAVVLDIVLVVVVVLAVVLVSVVGLVDVNVVKTCCSLMKMKVLTYL